VQATRLRDDLTLPPARRQTRKGRADHRDRGAFAGGCRSAGHGASTAAGGATGSGRPRSVRGRGNESGTSVVQGGALARRRRQGRDRDRSAARWQNRDPHHRGGRYRTPSRRDRPQRIPPPCDRRFHTGSARAQAVGADRHHLAPGCRSGRRPEDRASRRRSAGRAAPLHGLVHRRRPADAGGRGEGKSAGRTRRRRYGTGARASGQPGVAPRRGGAGLYRKLRENQGRRSDHADLCRPDPRLRGDRASRPELRCRTSPEGTRALSQGAGDARRAATARAQRHLCLVRTAAEEERGYRSLRGARRLRSAKSGPRGEDSFPARHRAVHQGAGGGRISDVAAADRDQGGDAPVVHGDRRSHQPERAGGRERPFVAIARRDHPL
jgi:hypothetical protein